MAYNPMIQDRSDVHLSQGMGAMAQGLSQGLHNQQARKEQDKALSEMRKRYSKILEGAGLDRGEVDSMSIGEQEGAIESIAMQLANRQQKAQTQQIDLRNRYMGQQMQQEEQEQAGALEMLKRARSIQQGEGSGVYKSEVLERYRRMLEDPGTAAAVETGAPPEFVQRYFGDAGAGLNPLQQAQMQKTQTETERMRREMETAPGTYASIDEAEQALGDRPGQAVQGTDGRWRLQFQTGSQAREHNVERLIRLQREAEGSGDTQAAEVYRDVIEKLRGGLELDPHMMRTLSLTNPEAAAELIREEQRWRAGSGGPPPAPEPSDPATPPAEEARKSVLQRLGL